MGVVVAPVGAGAPRVAPHVRLVSERTATVGSPWRAVVELSGLRVARPPLLRATLGPSTRSARMRRSGTRRWSGSVRFPTAGAWRLQLQVGVRRLALGVVTARSGAPAILDPVKIELDPSGSLLVADIGASRLVRVSPATGSASVVASNLPRLAAVTLGPDGSVFVVADDRLQRLEGGRHVELHVFSEEGPTDLAADAAGTLYVARYGDHVDAYHAGEVRVVARGFDRPHGVAIAPDGSLVVADTHAGAVRRIAADGSVATLATGLSRPIDVAIDPEGGILVAELTGGVVDRISPAGELRVLSDRPVGPSSVAVARDGTIFVADPRGPIRLARLDSSSGTLSPLGR